MAGTFLVIVKGAEHERRREKENRTFNASFGRICKWN